MSIHLYLQTYIIYFHFQFKYFHFQFIYFHFQFKYFHFLVQKKYFLPKHFPPGKNFRRHSRRKFFPPSRLTSGAHGAPYLYPVGDPGPPTFTQKGPMGPLTVGFPSEKNFRRHSRRKFFSASRSNSGDLFFTLKLCIYSKGVTTFSIYLDRKIDLFDHLIQHFGVVIPIIESEIKFPIQ